MRRKLADYLRMVAPLRRVSAGPDVALEARCPCQTPQCSFAKFSPMERKDSALSSSYVERGPDVRVETSPQGELERLYRDHRDRMWRAVFAFAGDREIANDAVSEAFAQALRRGDEIRSPERWLWRTVFRVAAGELKLRGRRGP